jgi:hypothetical protein
VLLPSNLSRYDQLVLAVATGESVRSWCTRAKVARSTASTWTARPTFRADVQAVRTRLLDQALGRLAGGAETAADGMLDLATNAKHEGTRLAAQKGVLEHLVGVWNWADVMKRLEALEAKDRARSRDHAGDA